MQITEKDFRAILEYVSTFLQGQCMPAVYENGYGADMVAKATIIALPNMVKLSEFLLAAGEKKERVKPVPEADNSGFEEFWSAYPASANFQYKGMTFTSSRVLRSNHQVCSQLFRKGIVENGVTAEQITNALKKQVQLAKDESYEKGDNKLAFFPGIEVFLRQARYMGFLDIEGGDETTEETNNYSNCG